MPLASWYTSAPNPRRAGFRYRCLYPLQALQACNLPVELFNSAHSKRYTSVVFDAWSVFPSVASDTSQADYVIKLAEQLKQNGTHIILDNCDNPFSDYSDPAWQEGLTRLRTLFNLADTLVTCSEALIDILKPHCTLPAKIAFIDDPVEDRIVYPNDSLLNSILSPTRKLNWLRYLKHAAKLKLDQLQGRTPLVWFGNHGTQFAEGGMLDLLRLQNLLEELALQYPISLSIISNNPKKFAQNFHSWSIPVHYLEWDRITFLPALRLHKICLIPATLNEFTTGKSTNRPVLALYHGLNVIADPIPSYLELQNFMYIGNWENALKSYLATPSLGKTHLEQAQAFIKTHYTLPVIAEKWRQLLFKENTQNILPTATTK